VSGGVLTDASGPVGDGDVMFGGAVGLVVVFGGTAVVSGGPVVIGCVVGGAKISGK